MIISRAPVTTSCGHACSTGIVRRERYGAAPVGAVTAARPTARLHYSSLDLPSRTRSVANPRARIRTPAITPTDAPTIDAATDDDIAYPLDPLSEQETRTAAQAASKELKEFGELRFNAISLAEPPKEEFLQWKEEGGSTPERKANVIVQVGLLALSSITPPLNPHPSILLTSVASSVPICPPPRPPAELATVWLPLPNFI